MSKTIDERVVSMQFDNKQFESNVRTTMSTLDKLKQSLNFTGASKGLESINGAVKKCDVSPLGTAVDSVRTKFSALEIMGVTALANITNSAVNAGKRIASALTIDPVRTGLSEYETQINSTQTILANTQSKGSTIDDVNRALEELNKYADLTIYNFTEMTRNIGTFTAAGVDLDTATNAIKGIANLAAVSGSTSQQASTAMYQLSQALASGTVKLMDWNSVVNAGMGGQVFQDALKETARVHGVAIDEMIEKEGSFRETLSSGWLTSEILTDTLEKFTMYAEEGTAEWDEFMTSLRDKGYTEEQAKEILKLGKTATEAATKVKTFTQLWDVLKESAQSGWSQSWKIIIGDFEQAKETLSPLADVLTGIIGKFSDARNFFLEGVLAFNKPWESIEEKIESISGIGDKIDKIGKKFKTVTDKVEYFQDVVNKVWKGEYNNRGDAEDRFDLLTAAGYDPRVVQELVNLGHQHELTIEEVEAAHKKYGLVMDKSSKTTDDFKHSTYELADATKNLTDEQLKNAGLTDDEIKLYRDLEKEANRLGITVDELAEKMSTTTGRDLLIGSFKNIGDVIIGIFKAIGKAWGEFFSGPSIARTYTLIESLNNFTEALRFTNAETGELTEVGKKFQRIFEGMFAAAHIVTTILKGPLSLAFELVKKVLAAFDLDILGVIANISDLIVKFHDWFIENDIVTKAIDALADAIANAIKWVQNWVNTFKELDYVQEFWTNITKNIGNMVTKVGAWASKFDDIFGKFFDALNSMDEITFDGVLEAFIQLRTDILAHFETFSEAFHDLLLPVGTFITALLEQIGILDELEAIKEKITSVADAFKNWFTGLRDADDPIQYVIDSIQKSLTNLLESIKNIWSKIWAHLTGSADENASEMNDSGEGIGTNLVLGIIKGIWEGIKTVFLAIKTFCTTIIETVMAMFGIHSPSTVFMAIGGFLIAGLVLGIVTSIPSIGEALSKLGTYISENFESIVSNIGTKISELFSNINFSKLYGVFGSLATLLPNIGILAPISAIFRLFDNLGVSISNGATTAVSATKNAATSIGNGFSKVFEVIKNVVTGIIDFLNDHFDSIAVIIGGVATAIGAVKLAKVATGLVDVLGAIPKGLKNMFESFGQAREIKAKAKLILSYAIAIGVLAAALYFMSKLSWGEIGKGAAVIAGLAVILGGLTIALNKLTSSKGAKPEILDSSAKNMKAMAKVMIGIAASVAILAYALKLVDDVDDNNIWRNLAVIGILTVGVAALAVVMSKLAPQMTKGTLSIIAIAAAVLLLTIALSKINALTIDNPGKTIGSLLILIGGLALISAACKSVKGGTAIGLIGMVLSIYLFIGLLKRLDDMNFAEIDNGLAALGGIILAFAGLMMVTNLAGENVKQASKAFTRMAVAFILAAFAIKILAGIDEGSLKTATAVITWLGIIMTGLIAVSKFAGQHAAKAGMMLISAAAAILILTAAIGILSRIDNAKGLIQAMAVITILMSLFAGLIFVSKYAGDARNSLIAIAITIGVLVASVALMTILAKDPATLWQAVAAISAIMIALSFVVKALEVVQGGKGSLGAVGKLVVMMGIIALLGWCVYQLAKIPDPKNALIAAGALSAVMIALGIAIKTMSKVSIMGNNEFFTLISLLAAMVVVVAVLGRILKDLGGLDPKSAISTAVALGVLLNAMASACWILSQSKQIGKEAIGAAFTMAVVLVIIAAILGGLAALELDASLNNVGALSVLLLTLAASCVILSKAKWVDKSAVKAALGMAAVLAIIAIVLGLCQLMKVDAAYNNVAALGALLLVISGACFILSKTGYVSSSAIKAAMAMGIVLVEIAFVLGLCQLLNVDAAYNNVAALGALLLAISGACFILAKAKWIDKSAVKAAVAMGVVLAEIALVLGLCQLMKVDAAYNNVAALGDLLLVISGACFILSKTGYVSSSAIKAAMAMGIVLAEIAIVLALCQKMGVDAAMNNVLALSTLLIAISFSCAILSAVKSVSAGAILAVAALGLIMLELGWVLSKIGEMNVEPCIGVVLSLSALLIALSIVTVILSAVGANAINAIPAAVGLMGVIAVIGGVALAIGGLMSLISPETIEKWSVGLQSFMDFIVILCTGIGEAVGGLIGGTLSGIGQGLSDFMTNLQGFIDGAKSIDISMAEGLKALGAAILAITAASILDGLSKLLGLGSMESLGENMATFGEAMISFAESISTLTEEDIGRIKMAADAGAAMADMESAVTKTGGLLQSLLGTSDMETFGERMAAFGGSLITFSDSITNLTEDDIAKIKLAADAGNAMADMESSTSRMGGVLQNLLGETDMADFGTRMVAFGACLIAYSASIKTLTEDDITKIQLSADAGSALADMEKSMPKMDGLWQKIAGEVNMEEFGARMASFGTALVQYVDAVSNLSEDAAAKIENSKAAAEALVGVYEVLPEDDGWWGDIAGERDPSSLGNGMYDLARGLSRYATAAASITDDTVTDIKNSKDAIEALSDVADAVPREGGWGEAIAGVKDAASFGTNMGALADSLMTYAGKVSSITEDDITNIGNSKTAITAMADAAKALPNEGGLAGLLAGENSDFVGFGSKMIDLAAQVMTYASTVSTITEDDIIAIGNSKTAIIAMAQAAKALPNEGGLVSLLAGENSDIVGFGDKMVGMAHCVMNYASTVSTITEDDIEHINNSKDAIRAMASAAKALPNEGGLAGLLAGENSDISGFGTKMVALALSVKQYLVAIAGITEESITLIALSGRCVAALVGVSIRANMLGALESTDITAASTNLLSVAELLNQYSNKVADITEETVIAIVRSGNAIFALAGVASKASLLNELGTAVSDAAINQLLKLVDLAKSMNGVDFGSMSTFAQSLGNLGNAGVQQFISAFTDAYSRASDAGAKMMSAVGDGIRASSDTVIIVITMVTGVMINTLDDSVTLFHTKGVALMTQLTSGMIEGGRSMSIALVATIAAAITVIRGQYTSWYNAGSYLVEGFASGINANSFKAAAAASAMAQAALTAAKEKLKINSPSKVFRDVIGKSIPEGLAAGIDKFTYMIKDSTNTMSDTALSGTKKALTKLADYVDADIDTQPTIRPVLDLSDIASGVNSISGMFSMTPSVGVLANVGSISSMMNNQNGANDDVVSAINKLHNGLDNLGNISYNINGVNVSDDASVVDAIQRIARKATVERRV